MNKEEINLIIDEGEGYLIEFKESLSKINNYNPFGKQLLVDGIGASYGKHSRHKTWIGKEHDWESSLSDFGVRKYDEEIGQFTRIDPLFEKYYGWSPYVYSANNPIIFKDDNGKWLTYIHEDIIREAAVGLGLTNADINKLVEGTRNVDKDQVDQSKHEMLNSEVVQKYGEDKAKADAEGQMKKFMSDKQNEFITKGNFEALGESTHPIQDSYAPAHAGWQEWKTGGPINPLNWPHLLGDIKLGNKEAYQKAVEETRAKLIKAIKLRKQYIESETEKLHKKGQATPINIY